MAYLGNCSKEELRRCYDENAVFEYDSMLEKCPWPQFSQIVSQIDCSSWGCDCQQMSDVFGTLPLTWGAAPPLVKPWWLYHDCKTRPRAPAP